MTSGTGSKRGEVGSVESSRLVFSLLPLHKVEELTTGMGSWSFFPNGSEENVDSGQVWFGGTAGKPVSGLVWLGGSKSR